MGAHPDLMKVPLCSISAERNTAALQSTRDIGILRSYNSSDDGKMRLLSKNQLEAKTRSAGEERRSSVWEERGGRVGKNGR